MNENPLNGKQISSIDWPDGAGEVGRSLRENADLRRTLEYLSEYHGDHDECWVVVKHSGVETARHNTRFIESIIWKPT